MANILIVEDDPDVAGLISHRLEASGHQPRVAMDGEAAVTAAYEATPDAIVLDWMLPRRNGIEVCEALRADLAFAATRIIMLTARAQASDPERAFAAGADDYMTKPFSPRELVRRIEALLTTGVRAV